MKRNPRWPVLRRNPPVEDINSAVNWSAVEAARAQQQFIRQEKKLMNQWVKGNNDFDSKNLLAKWRNTVRNHRGEIMNIIVDTMSLADAAVEANNALRYGMEMEEVSLDMAEVTTILGKVVRLRLTELFAEKSGMRAALNKELMARAIAREFPTKDNVATPPRQVNIPPVVDRVERTERPAKTPTEKREAAVMQSRRQPLSKLIARGPNEAARSQFGGQMPFFS